MLLPTVPQPTVVTHAGGQKFSIQIRSHEIMVDQTIRGGGEDTAPTPIELLGAALGSCIAYYVRQFLRTRELPAEGLRVEVVQNKGANPPRVEEFLVRVMLPPEIPLKFLSMIEHVIHACPAHNTLSMGSSVCVTREIPEPALTTA
jgi:uncharacterized OsmC-like protein